MNLQAYVKEKVPKRKFHPALFLYFFTEGPIMSAEETKRYNTEKCEEKPISLDRGP